MSRSKRKNKNPRNHKRRNEKRKACRNMQQPEKPTVPPVSPSPESIDNKSDAVAEPEKPSSNAGPPAQQDNAHRRRWTWDRVATLATVLYYVAEISIAGAVAYFAWVQASVSENQLGEMRRAANEQGEVTEKQLAGMRGQLDAMNKSIAVAEKSANAAVTAAKAAEEGNATYRDSVDRSLRAYVLLTDRCMLSFNQATKEFTVNLELKNAGATPAHKISTLTCMKVEKPDFTGPWDTNHATANKEQELSAGPERTWGHNATMALTPDEVLKITSGTEVVWAYGTITYEDTFGKKRTTNFRFRQGDTLPQILPQVGVTYYSLIFPDKGNSSD